MSSNKAMNNNNNNNTSSIVYRSKLFKSAEQQSKPEQQSKADQQSKPEPQKQSTKSAYKTFCKVCQDAGKLESEFTSHNVRDKTGKTVCPTLLAQECRNCYQRGHTVKYCKLLQPASVVKQAYVAPAPVKKAVPKNVFMVLESDSEEDEPVQEQEKTEFPMLNAVTLNAVTLNAASTNQKPVLNYGKIIDKENDPATYAKVKEAEMREKAAKYAEEQEAKRQQDLIKWAKVEAAKEVERKAREERLKANAGKKFSWADAESDSEGDDEEEEDAYVPPKKQQQYEDNSAW